MYSGDTILTPLKSEKSRVDFQLLTKRISYPSPIADELEQARERLSRAGVPDPDADIERIVEFVTNGIFLNPDGLDRVLTLIRRRENREPIERIFGKVDFFGLEFELGERVFRPCFETEATTEYALIAAEQFGRPVRILDLGSGTGCMLISLLKKLPDATGVGVDISADSLDLARRNADKHGVGDRAEFLVSDWINDVSGAFDIVVSNPPRIPEGLVSSLIREVSEYDPIEALKGGKDGLHFYRRLADGFRRIATEDAVGLIQAGDMVAEAAKGVFVRSGFSDVVIKRDYKFSPNCIAFKNAPMPSSFWRTILGKFFKS